MTDTIIAPVVPPPASDPRLDRVPAHDVRSLAYPIRSIIGPTEGISWTKRRWTPGPVLDQGQTGHCVSFGHSAELNATPVVDNHDTAYAHAMFPAIQAEDRAMGNNWSDGASVLAGVKAYHNAGEIGVYRWGFSVNDVVDCLVRKGPVILGINWYDEMFDPKPTGELAIGGGYAGGHCLTAIGYWPRGRLPGIDVDVVELQNSWSEDWGVGGFAFLPLPKLETLIGQWADILIVTDLRPASPALLGHDEYVGREPVEDTDERHPFV